MDRPEDPLDVGLGELGRGDLEDRAVRADLGVDPQRLGAAPHLLQRLVGGDLGVHGDDPQCAAALEIEPQRRRRGRQPDRRREREEGQEGSSDAHHPAEDGTKGPRARA
ncbi:MAG: hypothetical protein R3B09_20270 [Nannocystaceae bacterium]